MCPTNVITIDLLRSMEPNNTKTQSELRTENGPQESFASESPQRPNQESPRRLMLAQTYYARLSAEPGTEKARAQHIAVAAALKSLPGHVLIRHEFGTDEDDVLNVISFKFEGDTDGLEQIAALEGVIGIYPVRTRKRPKTLPLGALKRTRPSLQSAHVLTGIAKVHQKLGLTGKGIRVGIIDTGIDYRHPALGGCFGPGCKVAYGYDFVGDDYDNANPEKDTPKPDPDPMDCAGHGTHVAGIVAARNEGPNAMGTQVFVGVAPDVTLGAYRVFGCNGEVSDDVLLAALKRAYRDGMDVVNLSLGGSSGWPEEPFAIACSGYITKGLHIAVANGNDGEQGLFEDGAPATAVGAVAVGSVDNTHYLGTAVELAWRALDRRSHVAGPAAGQRDVGRVGLVMASDASDIPMASFKTNISYVIHVPAKDPLGCVAYNGATLEKSLQVPHSSIVVLIHRGGCTFSDKAKYVAKANLGGMLVYDTIPEQRPLGMTITGFNISAGGLSFEDATVILDAIEAREGKSNSQKLVAQFSREDKVLKLASGGKVSDFSSWGPDARLKYKPDIVTPGGMIYSTFPLAKGGFATLQGTSMASPYMAGIQALFLSKHGKTDATKLLNILQSTATPTVMPGSATGLTPVFQQGAGLVSMYGLFLDDEPPTVLSPTALYLNDTQFQRLDHSITFYNPSNTNTRSWTMVHRPALSVNGFDQSGKHFYTLVNQSRLRTSEAGVETVTMTPMQLRLTPRASGTIRIHIDPPRDTLDIEQRWLYSGFLEFQCHTDTGIECGSSFVSYGGMHGRLADIPILNPELSYPALSLDRYVNVSGAKTRAKPYESLNDSEKMRDKDQGKGNGKGGNPHKNLYRDRSERVVVGKDNEDWVQILISVNYPTSLLTIEAESVCDSDRGAGGGNGRIQVKTEQKREEAEQAVAQIKRLEKQGEEQDILDQERSVLVKKRLARSEELAFMPSGLYMPYKGYSRVMLQPSAIEETIRLHRLNKKNPKDGESKSVSDRKKTGRRKGRGRHGSRNNKVPKLHHRGGQRKGSKDEKKLEPVKEPKSGHRMPCVPRILGLIPNGFNSWNMRSDSADGNGFQAFAWMGDLLLQNHEAVDVRKHNDGDELAVVDGSEDLTEKAQGGHKHRTKSDSAKDMKIGQMEPTRNLPDGRYRLVLKALKPWGVPGRASDVERWSSPVIVIRRNR
ncbi:hypothetical protein BGZ54_004918 [Gamsiella multidivaricata]|nr:hypothetical protein BGZ54_004918 [Gamsiella multidivaricata]